MLTIFTDDFLYFQKTVIRWFGEFSRDNFHNSWDSKQTIEKKYLSVTYDLLHRKMIIFSQKCPNKQKLKDDCSTNTDFQFFIDENFC